MFQEPHINDFYANVRWHLNRSVNAARVKVGNIRSNLAGRGMLQSSVAVQQITAAVQEEFEAGVDRAFGELKRVIKITSLDPQELRQAALQCLDDYLTRMKALMNQDSGFKMAGDFLMDQQGRLRQHLEFTTRQFDVGFSMPDEPEVPKISNAINVHQMIGSTIQQGSPGASQQASVRVDFEAARRSVGQLEEELNALPATPLLADLRADVATIKAQLAKSSPSESILRETIKSARKIGENAATNVMTSKLTAALAALASSLGF